MAQCVKVMLSIDLIYIQSILHVLSQVLILICGISSNGACPEAGQADGKGRNHADILIFH